MERRRLEELVREASERGRHFDASKWVEPNDVPADFKHTRTFFEVLDAIALGKRITANLVLITGQNGGGKTTALKILAKSVPDTLYWEARAGYEPKHVLQDILRELPVATGDGWRAQTSLAIDYLADHPKTFLMDEAQRLNYHSLDLLKYVADNSGSTFVLSASPSLSSRIDKWPDISSRCPVRIEVRPISLEEFVELWGPEGWSQAVLEEVHRLSRGVMRTIKAIFLVLDDYRSRVEIETKVQVGRFDVRAEHVRGVAAGVVPANLPIAQLARPS